MSAELLRMRIESKKLRKESEDKKKKTRADEIKSINELKIAKSELLIKKRNENTLKNITEANKFRSLRDDIPITTVIYEEDDILECLPR